MRNLLVALATSALFIFLSAPATQGANLSAPAAQGANLSAPTAQKAKWKEINADELKRMMDNNDVLVVFPLSRIEFNDLRIMDAVNIPILRLKKKLPKDRDTKIAFYCLGKKSMGSIYAAGVAAKLGYRNIYVFRDGLPGWSKAGYPTDYTQKLLDIKPPSITAAALKRKLNNDENFIMLDIRVKFLTKKYWIPTKNRLYIPLYKMIDLYSRVPKGKDIVVIDEDGERSPVAVRFLFMKGYNDISYVRGGIRQWMSEGYSVASMRRKK
jgi:rhodanese-related sulfurtransferase